MICKAPIKVAKGRAGDHIHHMQYFRFLSLLSLATLPALGAHAASSNWHHVDGGSIRIVTSGTPDAAGQLRGALEIRLKPGWKTYWRDPGASGVPPTLEVMAGTQAASVEIGFPAPNRFDDGYATWAGYDHPVSLALTIDLPEDAPAPTSLEADIFLGLCETICIPVSTRLALNPGGDIHNPEHAILVEAAFSALPQPAQKEFSAKVIGTDDKAILIEAEIPDGANLLDLFVAGTQELTLDTPEQIQDGSQTLFRVPIMAHDNPGSEYLAYTLVTDSGAVNGHMQLP